MGEFHDTRIVTLYHLLISCDIGNVVDYLEARALYTRTFVTLDKSGLSPNTSQVTRYRDSFLKLDSDDVKKRLSNISFVDDESEGPYSERPIDVDGENYIQSLKLIYRKMTEFDRFFVYFLPQRRRKSAMSMTLYS